MSETCTICDLPRYTAGASWPCCYSSAPPDALLDSLGACYRRGFERLAAELAAILPVAEAAVAFIGCESHADADAIELAVTSTELSAVDRLRVNVERLDLLRKGLARRHEQERAQYGDLADCTREVLMAELAEWRAKALDP